MINTMDYEVKLEIFEGPLDLLLHLIRKNEVDIFDIPIAIITDQYLEYLNVLKAFNINLAGDFLVMASTLILIKSKMLIPEFQADEEDEDPRAEIVRPLLEYMQLKEMAGELTERDILGRDVFVRKFTPDFKAQIGADGPMLEVNLFQLIDAFKRVVDQRLPGAPLKFQTNKWSLKDKMTHIMDRLKPAQTLHFTQLFEKDRTISELIITFLALLELVHLGMLRVFQTDLGKDILIEAVFDHKEA